MQKKKNLEKKRIRDEFTEHNGCIGLQHLLPKSLQRSNITTLSGIP